MFNKRLIALLLSLLVTISAVPYGVKSETIGRSRNTTTPMSVNRYETTPSPENLVESFSREDWKRINIFLSNFSEQHFEDYNGTVQGNEYNLISFAFWHIYLNDFDSKVYFTDAYNELWFAIARADIDKCINRFFGMTVPPGDYHDYWDDAYHFPEGYGEGYDYFSIVSRMEMTSLNTYKVWFDVYSFDDYADFLSIPSSYYYMTNAEAAASPKLTYRYSGVAEVRDYQNGSKQTYQLIRYDRFDMSTEPSPTSTPDVFQHTIKSHLDENRDFTFNENETIGDLVFSTKSTEYNPRLAHFLSCMARAAYNEELIKDNYKVLGFSDPIQRHYDGGDPFAGFTIGKKQLDDESLMVLITIRGTDGWSEWLETNFHITTIDPPKGWHDGFAASADKVYQYLKSYLGGNILTNDVTYVICGHSLGGAVGNLLSVRLYNDGVPNTDVYDYNFACPNVAIGPESISEWNNNGCHNNIINIGNWCDIVTHLPGVSLEPSFTGYKWKKYGVSYWFNNGWQFLLSHDMAVYLDYLEKELDETYFTESEFVVQTIIGYCPVDITVYDSEGNPIVGTENNIPKYYGYEVGEKAVIYVQDDKKAIQIIGEEKCEVHIQATDDGEMDYIYCRHELVSGNTLVSKHFGSVKLTAGKEMVSFVGGEMSVQDVKLFITDGNAITHEILEDGTETAMEKADDEQSPVPSAMPKEETTTPAATPEENQADDSAQNRNKSVLIILISVPIILLLALFVLVATKKKK